MWIFFIILTVFSILNLANLVLYNGGAGMEPIWVLIIICSAILSIRKVNVWFFSKWWFKGIFVFCVVFFIIVELMIIQAGKNNNMTKEFDYVIVLGARVKGETMSLTLKKRASKAVEYAKTHDKSIIVLSGGQGPGENITEAEAMRRYFISNGINEDRLMIEDKSTSTLENLNNSFKLINFEDKNANIVVITSHFHIYRSQLIAKSLEKEIEGIGVPTLQFLVPNYYLREFFAVLVQWARIYLGVNS